MWPELSNGEPLLSRSDHERRSLTPTVVSGLLLSVMLAPSSPRPTPLTYRATLALIAVRPLPNTSYDTPTRGLRSLWFSTVPTHPCARLFFPSGHLSNVSAALKVPAGSVSGSVAVINQSHRRPALIVIRLMVHRS